MNRSVVVADLTYLADIPCNPTPSALMLRRWLCTQ